MVHHRIIIIFNVTYFALEDWAYGLCLFMCDNITVTLYLILFYLL